jgi:hypothetical protein
MRRSTVLSLSLQLVFPEWAVLRPVPHRPHDSKEVSFYQRALPIDHGQTRAENAKANGKEQGDKFSTLS